MVMRGNGEGVFFVLEGQPHWDSVSYLAHVCQIM